MGTVVLQKLERTSVQLCTLLARHTTQGLIKQEFETERKKAIIKLINLKKRKEEIDHGDVANRLNAR